MKTLSAILTAGAFFLSFNPGIAHASTTFINNVTVFDSIGNLPFKADVIVVDDRIEAIGKQLAEPQDAMVIDGSNLSMIAGLIDVHTHWRNSRAQIATALLKHGVTTVTDFHSSPDSYAAKRKWHESLISPHVAYAARIAPPGGHGADWGDERMTRLVASPQEAVKVMEYLDTYQPDLIKIFADGWRYGNPKEDTDISLHALTELTQQATARGWPVVSHTVTVAGGRRAAKGGINAIVHAIQNARVDDQLAQLIAQEDVYYAPTLAIYEMHPDKIANYSALQLQMGSIRQQNSRYNLAQLQKAGVKLAMGTDSGIGSTTFGESSVHELELLVDFGVSPSEALIASTRGSAEALGLSEDRGTLEVNKRADFVLVKGQPWKNISDFRNISAVFVNGVQVIAGGELVGQQGPDIPPSTSAMKMIDDFEGHNGKTSYGTLRRHEIDYSFPRSKVLSQTKPYGETNNHRLAVSIELENKPKPKAGVIFPLSDGSFVPVDAAKFTGVSFDINAKQGTYWVTLDSYGGKGAIDVDVVVGWQTVVVPFDSFKRDGKFDISALKSLSISVTGEGEQQYWMELDNVQFTQ